jgi:hypothetical protein
VAELAYDRLQKTLAKLEEGDRWRSNLTERLERLEQAGVLQEQRYSNLAAHLQRLAQLKSEFSNNLAQFQSQLSKLEESEINNIKMSKIGEDEREKLQNQIITLQQNLQAKTPGNNVDNKKLIFQVVNDRISEIYRELQQEIDQRWDIKLKNLQNQINQLQQNQQLRTSDNVAAGYIETQIPILLTEEQQLLKDYKDQEKCMILSKKAIMVSLTIESIDNIRLGFGKIVLKKARRGSYWILTQGSSQYLVPSDKIKIHAHNIDALKHLFECQGVNSEGYKGKFELLKPAKVSSIGEVMWQLEETGMLGFVD